MQIQILMEMESAKVDPQAQRLLRPQGLLQQQKHLPLSKPKKQEEKFKE
jgi:hypothetical protein